MLNNSLMTPNMRPNQPGLAQVLVEMLQVLTSHSAATDGPPEARKGEFSNFGDNLVQPGAGEGAVFKVRVGGEEREYVLQYLIRQAFNAGGCLNIEHLDILHFCHQLLCLPAAAGGRLPLWNGSQIHVNLQILVHPLHHGMICNPK